MNNINKSEKLKKIIISVLSIIFILVVLSPVAENFKEKPEDDFPLSYYPMFTKKRGEETNITHIIGFDNYKN
ncbi:MAG: hypothetical protein GTO02_17415 [Candidatus Dadabacteria bacterium]|nr:hypothetical protein [Candidatus Dadabacteria bacterium]